MLKRKVFTTQGMQQPAYHNVLGQYVIDLEIKLLKWDAPSLKENGLARV